MQLFQKLKLNTKNLQEQSILLLTITRYIVRVLAEKNHTLNKAYVYNKHANKYRVCK